MPFSNSISEYAQELVNNQETGVNVHIYLNQTFKQEIIDGTAQLQDVDCNVMTAEDARNFVSALS